VRSFHPVRTSSRAAILPSKRMSVLRPAYSGEHRVRAGAEAVAGPFTCARDRALSRDPPALLWLGTNFDINRPTSANGGGPFNRWASTDALHPVSPTAWRSPTVLARRIARSRAAGTACALL